MTQSKVLYATFDALPGKRDKVIHLLSELAEQIRTQEEGNLKFKVFHSTTDPNHFHVEEEFASEDALSVHTSSAHRAKFDRELAPLITDGQTATVTLEALSF